MRNVMWFSIGFGIGCFVFCGFPIADWLVAVALAGTAAVGLLGVRFHPARIGAVLLAGFGIGLCWCRIYESRYLVPAASLDGVKTEATITATGYSVETDFGRGVDGTVTVEGKSYGVRAYLEGGEELPPGTTITGTFQFQLTTPQGVKGGTSHAGNGIFLLAYQKDDVEYGYTEKTTVSLWAARLRRQIMEILTQCIPADAAPVARALLLGNVTELPYGMDADLKVSGIRHVAAVSGLHVSILFAMVNGVMQRRRFLSALAGMPMLFVIAALAGFTPSVTRACIMCGMMLLAGVCNREYDGFTALYLAVLVMLARNPYGVTSVGLQLSVASVTGIFLLTPRLYSWLEERLRNPWEKRLAGMLKEWFMVSVSTSLGAMVFTAPLGAWYFGMVSLVGVLTNLLTLWIISFVFYGLILTCGMYLLYPPLGSLLGKMTAVLIRYIQLVAGVAAKLPLAAVYTESVYIVIWLVFAYVLLAVFLLVRKKEPIRFFSCLVLGLCVALLCSWGETMGFDTCVTVLDVGQGQCILLQNGGKTFLVDCGGDDDREAADAAASLLYSRGISRLDGLIVTHTDGDHMGGAANLLSRVDTALLILPTVCTELEADSRIFVDRTVELSWDGGKMTIFGEKFWESTNENSLCILLDTEKCDILITGDRSIRGEERLIDTGMLRKVDVLIAGHHGSRTATSRQLLEILEPELVCISVGADNPYGHPAQETLQRLAEFGCRVYRTDHNGTITIRR